MLKYPIHQVNVEEIKKYSLKHVISCEVIDENLIIDIDIRNEEGFGWTEGEGVLADLLPIYDEIKSNNYQFLLSRLNIIKAKHLNLF